MLARLASLAAPALTLIALTGCSDDEGSGGAPSTTSSTTGSQTASSSSSNGTSVASSTASSAASTSASTSSTGFGANCDPPAADVEPLQLVPFVSGIDQPISMAPHPTNPSRLFIAGRTGIIHVVDDGVVLPTPFLDISADVSCCDDDRGFLNVVLHPDYENNGLFYVHYTRVDTVADSTTVLAEYKRSDDDPDVADPVAVRELLTLDQAVVWHYGGTITFGPDGMLYYARGDGGGEGDPEGDAQDPSVPLGKILRIDTTTFPTPPPGNMPGAAPFVWDMGLRNPWRMSFDRCTGDLYVADVGQGYIEEVSVQLPTQQHLNFGWNEYEGTSCFAPPCDPAGMHMPAAEHVHSDGWCAIVGGHAYRGNLLAGHRGRYFYGDLCSRRIVSFKIDAAGAATAPMDHTDDLDAQNVLGDYMFGSFGEDLEGELYVLDMSGTVFRIEPD
jgi:glucose/arabinose dehydrogenase